MEICLVLMILKNIKMNNIHEEELKTFINDVLAPKHKINIIVSDLAIDFIVGKDSITIYDRYKHSNDYHSSNNRVRILFSSSPIDFDNELVTFELTKYQLLSYLTNEIYNKSKIYELIVNVFDNIKKGS